jgi:tetratricopeptide (TPR) repeat protein
VICAVAGSDDGCWSSEALALASLAATYLDLRTADELAARSGARAASDRDQAYARLSAGWVLAYRQEEAEALGHLDPVIAYARGAAEPWLEACAWQARGQARERAADAFSDWQEAVTRFVAAGDMMHASNVRYMLAYRAVEAGERLAEVPVWLRECESYAASHGYRHELAHIHNVRAVYERTQGRLDTARELLDSALTVFRQAGDFRCTTRTLIELAEHHRPDDPAAAADLLLRGLGMAMLAGGGLLRARVLASLVVAAAAAGDLPLAARALGALGALDAPDAPGRPQALAVPADLASTLQAPAFNSYVDEGRVGGISLITTLYPAA